ncbi:response regulator transcription factor [Anaerocolumna chitinilytica]|uniref:Stage 0 sporulation protein A homolog n=1 Tax=Anaerocolumna chitinilytica TaxID=1727145 RepID=A0A7I8DRQ9_9FIRM|nr:response regulator transcription factor [Anaerocolumna chitinilytica]BCK00953.1 DNA-binding response regulator [Anaerocolumna chitinilytica]
MRVLLIEDDTALCEAITLHLKKEGYQTDICGNGEDAVYYIEKHTQDVIVLDRMLPGKDGLSILNDIRDQGITTPVIMVTAMNGINDRIDGLDGGADDYLVKPFAMDEFLARIRALLRRPRNMKNTPLLSYKDISLDTSIYMVSKGEKQISLSKREGAFLEYLMLNQENIVTREQILNRVWGLNTFVEDGNIDNYISFLRRRLKALDTHVCIKTVHGIGYRLEYSSHA